MWGPGADRDNAERLIHPTTEGRTRRHGHPENAPEIVDMVQGMVDEGQTVMPGIGSDIAKPGVVESAYEGTPLKPLLSLIAAAGQISNRLGDITCPVLIMTSPQDHVVDPTASDLSLIHI